MPKEGTHPIHCIHAAADIFAAIPFGANFSSKYVRPPMKLKKALAPTMAGKTSPTEPLSFWLSLCCPAAELASIVVGRVVIDPGSGLECP
jgi:hypothetical protein